MLKLADFFHLPQVDTFLEQLTHDGPGLAVVAGLDLRSGEGFLPSGRSTIFRILMREILAANPDAHCVVVTRAKDAVRVPRAFQRRTMVMTVRPFDEYQAIMAEAARRRPDLLVLDTLDADNAALALAAAAAGLRVLSQVDSVFRGAGVARHLLDLGVSRAELQHLAWIISVQRQPALCLDCKLPYTPDAAQLNRLLALLPQSEIEPDHQPVYYRAVGCPACEGSGRKGDVLVFDIFRGDPGAPNVLEQPSLLPAEDYVLGLAVRGYLPLGDVLHFESEQFHRTYKLLVASERALADSHAALERRVAELEVAHNVLQQRTKALISLQDIGQALISSDDLDALAVQVCWRARDLCGADRAILYYLRDGDQAEVLALQGWDPALLHTRLPAEDVFRAGVAAGPVPYDAWPPGTTPRPPDVEGARLRAGLYVPLLAQEQHVGVMIVHSTHQNRFEPGEVALLQTFANQAAVAIQRAGLVEDLREKIAELEAA
ncbi:MAG: GAF domain-containing protein, partial [Chloroflexi bacterium]|nr:GAF domain-containing protein [Chloroflexota bacterium]